MKLLPTRPVVDEVAEKRAERERIIREARVANARRQQGWEEIAPAERLRPRGPSSLRWLVDAEDDAVYVVAPGTYFDPHSAAIVADRVEATFYVNAAGHVVVLERVAAVPSWSRFVERQARRNRQAEAS